MDELSDRAACLEPAADSGLVEEIRRVLRSSEEPLTLARIRVALPPEFRSLPVESLAEALERQVAANVLLIFPRYRSRQERYWDRPLRVHLEQLLHSALRERPCTWSELRKRLPGYARRLVEPVLEELLAKGKLFRYPPVSSRKGPRYGLEPPDPRPYLQAEFAALMQRCEQQGLARPLVRAALLDLLRAEEWAPPREGAQEISVDYHYVARD
jgi:hypothetical protein